MAEVLEFIRLSPGDSIYLEALKYCPMAHGQLRRQVIQAYLAYNVRIPEDGKF